MGYKIDYSQTFQEEQQDSAPKSMIRIRVAAAGYFLIFLLVVKCIYPAGFDLIRSKLIPDPKSSTQQAIDLFVMQIQHGEDFEDALYAFCVELIDGEEDSN